MSNEVRWGLMKEYVDCICAELRLHGYDAEADYLTAELLTQRLTGEGLLYPIHKEFPATERPAATYLACMFQWTDTPQGAEHWGHVHSHLYAGRRDITP